MHLSAPLSIQEEGESAPIKELQKHNKELERLVNLKTQELLSINEKLSQKNEELERSLQEVKTLKGLIPICANCKNIRDDEGYWSQVETYLLKHSELRFSHGICPKCAEELYGDLLKD